MSLLLDTHIWLWFVEGSRELPVPTRRLIDRSVDRCHVSAISAWELALLADRGRVRLDRDVEGWIDAARERLPVIEEPVDRRIALAATRLRIGTKDPADRFIAATAQVADLTLVTADDHLQEIPGVRVRSR